MNNDILVETIFNRYQEQVHSITNPECGEHVQCWKEFSSLPQNEQAVSAWKTFAKELKTFLLIDFFESVEKLAEKNMLTTFKLEGAHYNAMKKLISEMNNE